MPAITLSILKRATMIQKFLKDSYISSENYDSTQMPFFRRDNNSKEYEMDYQSIENIPTSPLVCTQPFDQPRCPPYGLRWHTPPWCLEAHVPRRACIHAPRTHACIHAPDKNVGSATLYRKSGALVPVPSSSSPQQLVKQVGMIRLCAYTVMWSLVVRVRVNELFILSMIST